MNERSLNSTRSLVVGLAFNESYEDIVFLLKNSSIEEIDGRLNGPGGKVEPGETPIEAVVREFYEETGVVIPQDEWYLFLTYKGIDDEGGPYTIYFFYASTDLIYEAQTTTDEEVDIYNAYETVTSLNVVPNLTWMIPFLQDRSIEHDLGVRYDLFAGV